MVIIILGKQKGITADTAVLILAVVAAAMGGGLYLVIQLQSSAPEKCSLTVSKEGTGLVEFEPEGGVYEKGEEVTVRAFPPPGGGFEGWSGDVSKDSSTITVVMNSDKHLVAHFSSGGALPGVKYPSAAELSESGRVWDSPKVWVNFDRTSMSWSLHEKTTACNPHRIRENLAFWKDNSTVKFRKVFTFYTCAENGYLRIEPEVKESDILLLKVYFDADVVSKCVSKFWLTGTIDRFKGNENVPSQLDNIQFQFVNRYAHNSRENVSGTQGNIKLGSSLADLDLSGSTPEKTSNLVDGANKFAFELYSQLAEENKNAFISPYSIHMALAMTYEGASGETAEEMETALNLPADDDVRLPAFADLHEKLNSDRAVELKTANALWPQENFPFYESYLEAVKRHYLARIESLDYLSNPDLEVKRINKWAAEHTENKIKKILRRLDRATVLVLTNAIYFKGTWLIPFDKSRTKNEPFHLPDDSTVQVPMMQFHENRLEENEFQYSETDKLKALKLPYTGKEMSMIFLLPKDDSRGIGWLKKHVTKDKFEAVQREFERKKMSEVEIPKFEYKIRYQKELKKALKNWGMSSAFKPGFADFTNMSPLGKELFIEKVVHKAYVKIDEKGTEAAAVTAVVIARTSVEPSKPSFVANRPFMFLIKDERTGSILFMGSVANPQSE